MRAGELLFQGELALRLGQPEYAAAAARRVLEELPGHVKAHGLLGQALLERGLLEQAAQEFEGVLELDPENVVARSALAVALEGEGQLKGAIAQMQMAWEADPANPDLREALSALRAKLERVDSGPELSAAGLGRLYARKGQHAKALHLLRDVLAAGPPRADVLLAQAESLWQMERWEEAAKACLSVLAQAPQAVKARLLLGLIRLKRGDMAGGAALLHEAMSADPSGSVASAFLEGSRFQFPSLEEAVDISPPALPLPSEVEAALAAGVSAKGAEALEEMVLPEVEADLVPGGAARELQEALYRLSDRMVPRVREKAGQEPALGPYYLVTSRAALLEKYGERDYLAIERKLKALQEALSQVGYQADLLLLEDGEDPREVTERVQDQVRQAGASGGLESMGHILLVGGDDVLPFHRLANPAEDDDALLLSDVPYGAGRNLFVSRQSVGRLPDDGSGDARYLLALLDAMVASHVGASNGHARSLLRFLGQGKGERGKSFGYTALVWKAASQALQELVGGPLQVCPPITEKSLESGWMDRARFLLFNLHGTEESRYWYGQKDSTYPLDYPLFPIALSPDNLAQVDLSGAIIFTEACYGANIVGKSPQDSLALTLLRRGAACVVGATRLAYGASEPPLVAGDLLARYFWLWLEQGMTVGESLARARTRFVQEAQSRQGYLDGDDQKTALEFILLGDPAARLLPSRKGVEGVDELAEAGSQEAQLFCKRRSSEERVHVQGELLARARSYLKRVAPEAWDTQLSVLPRHCCPYGHFFECQGDCDHEKTALATGPYFITARKSLSTLDGSTLRRVARLTVDEDGRLLKACVSK